MRILLRNLLLAICLTGLIALVEPYFLASVYTARLASRPAPEWLKVPVDRVRADTLRDSWGASRSGGRRHEGIDIFAPRGTPVRSATEGVVADVGSSGRGGLVVWVIGPGRQGHYYAHLSRIGDIFLGQRVAAGTVLGYVGDTGNARGTPPHLHYGIYTGGGAINLYPLLRAGTARAGGFRRSAATRGK